MDWFQILRLSTLRHLNDTRNEARMDDHHSDAKVVRGRIARDLIRRVQLRWVAGGKMGQLRVQTLLREGVQTSPETVHARDFTDITEW